MDDKLPHDGHRSRLRQQIIKSGTDGLPRHNLLEFLLFHTIPRKDVNELAHTLITQFGSFSGVLDASYTDLCKIPGVSETTAAMLCSLTSIFRAYTEDKCERGVTFTAVEQVGEYIFSLFTGRSVETVIMLCMNLKSKVISTCVIATGTVDRVPLPIREIVKTALSVGAVSIAIGHNHPGGFALPSGNDITATRQLQKALRPLGIDLVDHVVVIEDDFVSMRLSGYLSTDL